MTTLKLLALLLTVFCLLCCQHLVTAIIDYAFASSQERPLVATRLDNSEFKTFKYALKRLTNPQFANLSEYGYTPKEMVNERGVHPMGDKALEIDLELLY